MTINSPSTVRGQLNQRRSQRRKLSMKGAAREVLLRQDRPKEHPDKERKNWPEQSAGAEAVPVRLRTYQRQIHGALGPGIEGNDRRASEDDGTLRERRRGDGRSSVRNRRISPRPSANAGPPPLRSERRI